MPDSMVYLSELTLTPLMVENGLLPVDGYHALAGLRLTGLPFDPQAPLDWATPEDWARRMARFWRAIGIGQQNGSGPWQTSFELRRGRQTPDEALQTSLWVKTFAPQDHLADQSAGELAANLQVLCPEGCLPLPVEDQEQMASLWGKDAPQWMAEVRRKPRPAQAAGTEVQTSSDSFYSWNPTPDGMRQVWELMERLPAPLWLSVGVCPTSLFASEVEALNQQRKIARRETHPRVAQYWQNRLEQWQQQIFLLRLRVGGIPQAAACLAQALAAALTEPYPLEHSPVEPPPAAAIVWPESPQAWEAARFNWLWADFLPWEENAAPSFARFPYLCDDRQAGILAGIW